MSRQHVSPYFITDSAAYQMVTASHAFDEAWLQQFIFNHPQALPVREIESIFAPLIPVCRELPTSVGPLDNVYINPAGLLTLVECKLWKNPQARREVIGQILDYAKEISRWSYTDLQAAIRKSMTPLDQSLFDVVANANEDLDQTEFIDNVARNLKRGRFLLLIVGDGIRESVELIAEFLQEHAHLNFSFALVELGIFQLPREIGDGYVVHPRIIARTVEIERAVVRIEDGKIVSQSLPGSTNETVKQRTQISEQAFYENVQISPDMVLHLKEFIGKARDMGLVVEPGQNSLKLKSTLYAINLGIFQTVGQFWNCGIASTTHELGFPQIGENYLNRLATLFRSGYVLKSENRFFWTVKLREGNRYLTIAEVLAVQEQWLNIIQATLNELAQIPEQTSKSIE